MIDFLSINNTSTPILPTENVCDAIKSWADLYAEKSWAICGFPHEFAAAKFFNMLMYIGWFEEKLIMSKASVIELTRQMFEIAQSYIHIYPNIDAFDCLDIFEFSPSRSIAQKMRDIRHTLDFYKSWWDQAGLLPDSENILKGKLLAEYQHVRKSGKEDALQIRACDRYSPNFEEIVGVRHPEVWYCLDIFSIYPGSKRGLGVRLGGLGFIVIGDEIKPRALVATNVQGTGFFYEGRARQPLKTYRMWLEKQGDLTPEQEEDFYRYLKGALGRQSVILGVDWREYLLKEFVRFCSMVELVPLLIKKPQFNFDFEYDVTITAMLEMYSRAGFASMPEYPTLFRFEGREQ